MARKALSDAQAQEPDGGVGAGAYRLGPFERHMGVEAVEVVELARQVDEQHPGGQDDAALKATAWREMAMDDDVRANRTVGGVRPRPRTRTASLVGGTARPVA